MGPDIRMVTVLVLVGCVRRLRTRPNFVLIWLTVPRIFLNVTLHPLAIGQREVYYWFTVHAKCHESATAVM
jgi:hypothetical protein